MRQHLNELQNPHQNWLRRFQLPEVSVMTIPGSGGCMALQAQIARAARDCQREGGFGSGVDAEATGWHYACRDFCT
jgi:hypothetical protein